MKKPSINMEMLKKKLSQLSGNGNSDKIWKPTESETTIRILPSAYNPEFPFTDLWFHYNIEKYGILSPASFERPDPLKEAALKLREEGSAESIELSKRLMPKSRTYAPIIVRGEEDKGVRLWAISYTLYKAILTLMADDDYGDITDVVNGTDLVIEYQTPKEAGNQYGKTSFRAKRNATPLSTDAALVEKWLSEQPDPKDLFEEKSYEELQAILNKWLEGGDAESTPESSESKETKEVKSETKLTETVESKEVKEDKPVEPKVDSNSAEAFKKLFDED